MRGYIYHITTDPDNLGLISADDFFEDLDALSIRKTSARRVHWSVPTPWPRP